MIRFSFSKNIANFTLPKTWSEISDADKLKIFKIMMLKDITIDETLTMIFISIANIRVVKKISEGWIIKKRGLFKPKILLRTWQIYEIVKRLKFITDLPTFPVQSKFIRRHKAVDPFLRDINFITYLTCDNYYQLYIKSGDSQFIKKMTHFLYSINDRIKLKPEEIYSVFYWWFSLKCYFAHKYTFLFSKTESEGAAAETIEDSVNSLVRVLTNGDITKQQQIYDHNAYSAIVELNEKAREVYELKKHMK